MSRLFGTKHQQENNQIAQKDCDLLCLKKEVLQSKKTEKVVHFHRKNNKSLSIHQKSQKYNRQGRGIRMSLMKNKSKSDLMNQFLDQKLHPSRKSLKINLSLSKRKENTNTKDRLIDNKQQFITPMNHNTIAFKNQGPTYVVNIFTTNLINAKTVEVFQSRNLIKTSKYLSPYETATNSEAKLSMVSELNIDGNQGIEQSYKEKSEAFFKIPTSSDAQIYKNSQNRKQEGYDPYNYKLIDQQIENVKIQRKNQGLNSVENVKNRVVRLCDTARVAKTLLTQSQASVQTQKSSIISFSKSNFIDSFPIPPGAFLQNSQNQI